MQQPLEAGSESDKRIQVADLRRIVTAIFDNLGFSRPDAALAADVLTTADLRGVTTHGVSNMLPKYVRWIREGRLDPQADFTLLRDAPSAASYDANSGLGIVHLPKLMDIAVDKARDNGVAFISVRNSSHSGMVAYHAMVALRHDMIGFCATAGNARVLPTFGREPRVGTNPISIAVPTASERPWVYDAATSSVAHNRLTNQRRHGLPLGPGWIADSGGAPIMVPTDLDDGIDRMLPLGSTPDLGSHKGYALSSIVDILSGILSAGSFSAALPTGQSRHFLGALHIEAFSDVDDFKSEMSRFCDAMRSTPPASGHDQVFVPNDLEFAEEQDRRARGIPLHPDVIQWLCSTCEDMRVDQPSFDGR